MQHVSYRISKGSLHTSLANANSNFLFEHRESKRRGQVLWMSIEASQGQVSPGSLLVSSLQTHHSGGLDEPLSDRGFLNL